MREKLALKHSIQLERIEKELERIRKRLDKLENKK